MHEIKIETRNQPKEHEIANGFYNNKPKIIGLRKKFPL